MAVIEARFSGPLGQEDHGYPFYLSLVQRALSLVRRARRGLAHLPHGGLVAGLPGHVIGLERELRRRCANPYLVTKHSSAKPQRRHRQEAAGWQSGRGPSDLGKGPREG